MLHELDPNLLDFTAPIVGRMYAGTLAQHECVVDYDDYLYFSKWLWVPKIDRRRSVTKIYFKRAISTYEQGADGRVERASAYSLYLHVEILKRHRGAPPAGRPLCDHLDGDSLNNRLDNLRWASFSENSRNLFGKAHTHRELAGW